MGEREGERKEGLGKSFQIRSNYSSPVAACVSPTVSWSYQSRLQCGEKTFLSLSNCVKYKDIVWLLFLYICLNCGLFKA